MTLKDIANIRLSAQQIKVSKFNSAKKIVGYIGAMQAQDYSMAKWAVGIRFSNSTDKIITKAIDDGEIIRTHLLRPTWHFVSADDIYWMLELTSPQIKSSMKSRNRELELTEAIFKKSNKIITKALSGGKHLTREELKKELEKSKILTNKNRLAHLLMRAELDGIICSGRTKPKKQTYTLLPERVKSKKLLKREEALAKLANKYFSSHCPATIQDFIWWSGLSSKDSRNALESIKSKLISETINSEAYWITNSFSISKDNKSNVYLLPAYDEFIISYKDRSSIVTFQNLKKAISNNGLFRPVIIKNGHAIGIWKRIIKRDKVIIETEFFQPPSKDTINLVERGVKSYANFLEIKTELLNN
jgi:DNA glycosylase AlkZ-like